MNIPILNQFVPLFVSVFILVWIITPFWIKKAKKAGLIGKDIHKNKPTQIAEMGGIVVLLGFIIGIVGYVAMRIFIFRAETNVTSIFAVLSAVLLAGIIGIMDDILGWKIGLKQWQKPLLTILAAAPIMAVNAGTRVMVFPIFGRVDLGIVFPLFIIPIFILIGTNGFNMLAGYNGLETGQGIIILSTLAYFSYKTGNAWITVVALCMVMALLGFLIYNKYPAKIFPGDTLTYIVGSLAAIIAIMANLEKIFLILFIPYIIEFFLKLRGKFKKESFAQINEDNTLTPRYNKLYGLENAMVKLLNKLKIKTTEKKVVYSLHGLQLICVVLVFKF